MNIIKRILCGILTTAGAGLIACAASTLDHAGSIPLTDGQLFLAIIIGGALAAAGVAGLNSTRN